MPEARDVILEVLGRSENAQRSIREIAEQLRRLPNTRTVAVRAHVDEARREISRMRDELDAIDRERVEPELRVRISKAILDLERFDRDLKRVVDADHELTLKGDKLRAELERTKVELERLRNLNPFAEQQASIEQSRARIQQLNLTITQLQQKMEEGEEWSPFDEANLRKALADVDVLEQRILKLEAVDPEVVVRAKIEDFEQKAARVRAELAALPEQHVVNLEARTRILEDLGRTERDIHRMTRALDQASAPARSFMDVLHSVIQGIKSTTPIVNGLAIILTTKLVPALLAVAASAGSALGGLVALGVGLAAALGPALAVGVAAAVRLGKVLEALKAQDAAKDAQQARSAAGSAAAAAAAEQRHNAELAVRDALQSVASAERQLAQARQDAAEQIAAAQQRAADAARDLARASEDVRRATTQAYREMADAAEEASDAIRGVRDAQLSLESARLGIREAQLDLKELREELGATGDTLSRVFQKFTDVDFQFDTAALEKALAGPGGAAVSERDQLRLERAILRVREAKQAEKNATDGLSDAQREANRAQQRANEFKRQGILASEGLRAALDRQADAQRAYADAQREANELEREGVSGAPGVISAMEGLRQAEQRLAEARRDRARIRAGVGDIGQIVKAEQAVAKLTATERQLLGVLRRVRDAMSTAFSGATDRVMAGIATALEGIASASRQLAPAFDKIGAAWQSVLTALTIEFTRPEWIDAFAEFAGYAAELSRVIGRDVFIQFARLMRDIALISLPVLVDLMRGLANALARINARPMSELRSYIDPMLDSFRVWMRLLGALTGLFLELFRAVGPIGDELVNWITDGVKAFTRWLRTAEGQEKVREFFEDTIPAVKGIIMFILTLVKLFLQFFQLTAPVLAGFLSAWRFVGEVISFVVGLLNELVSNPVGRFLRNLLGSFLGFGSVIRVFRLVLRGIQGLGAGVRVVGGRIGRWLIEPFRWAWSGIRSIINRLVGFLPPRIAGAMRSVYEAVRSRIVAIVDFFRRLPGQLWTFARRAANRVVEAFRGIGRRIGAFIAPIVATFETVLNGVIDALNFAIRGINRITPGKIEFGKGPFKVSIPAIPDIPQIPRLAQGGLATGATLAMVGEGRHHEAVLPLSRKVMRQLAQAIAAQMRLTAPGPAIAGRAGRLAPAMAGAGRAGTVIDVGGINVQAPAGALPDAEATAVALARRLERRAGGSPRQ